MLRTSKYFFLISFIIGIACYRLVFGADVGDSSLTLGLDKQSSPIVKSAPLTTQQETTLKFTYVKKPTAESLDALRRKMDYSPVMAFELFPKKEQKYQRAILTLANGFSFILPYAGFLKDQSVASVFINALYGALQKFAPDQIFSDKGEFSPVFVGTIGSILEGAGYIVPDKDLLTFIDTTLRNLVVLYQVDVNNITIPVVSGADLTQDLQQAIQQIRVWADPSYATTVVYDDNGGQTVYSENGFVVHHNAVRADDPASGQAYGYDANGQLTDYHDDDIDNDGKPNDHDGDMDGDGKPNWRDGDRDGDGIKNKDDPNPDQPNITAESESRAGAWFTSPLTQLFLIDDLTSILNEFENSVISEEVFYQQVIYFFRAYQ